MLDWLLSSRFETQVTAALWATAAAALTTVVSFFYTLGLRATTLIQAQRRARLVKRWRTIFALATISCNDAEHAPLPQFSRRERTDLLEEWNHAWTTVQGSAIDNLVTLGKRIGFLEIARRKLARHRLNAQLLGLQSLGHLRDRESWSAIEAHLSSENTALSVTAAAALMDIDAERAIGRLIPLIAERRDWPRTRVFNLLRIAGSELVSEPLARAIRSASSEDQAFLLRFAPLAKYAVMDAVAEELIRESNDAGVLSAALKQISGYGGVPRIAALTRHEAWFVRMEMAKVLGRIGQKEHLSLLRTLLKDREWWVRYRAARSIVKLPFLGPNALRRMRDCETDRYARDMFQQAMAEVGLE